MGEPEGSANFRPALTRTKGAAHSGRCGTCPIRRRRRRDTVFLRGIKCPKVYRHTDARASIFALDYVNIFHAIGPGSVAGLFVGTTANESLAEGVSEAFW